MKKHYLIDNYDTIQLKTFELRYKINSELN